MVRRQMKTANEWYQIVLNDGKSWPESIREIQLDAYKSGLMQAQLIASPTIAKWEHDNKAQNLSGLRFHVTKAIVAEADKLEPPND